MTSSVRSLSVNWGVCLSSGGTGCPSRCAFWLNCLKNTNLPKLLPRAPQLPDPGFQRYPDWIYVLLNLRRWTWESGSCLFVASLCSCFRVVILLPVWSILHLSQSMYFILFTTLVFFCFSFALLILIVLLKVWDSLLTTVIPEAGVPCGQFT